MPRFELAQRIAEQSPVADGPVSLLTRSVVGVLFYLSQSVEVPEEHVAEGLVTQTRTPEGDDFDWGDRVMKDFFEVRSSKTKPGRAAVAVPYRDYWFYIEDRDLQSKSTFSLLGQLISLKAGDAVKTSPLLTLPIGGE